VESLFEDEKEKKEAGRGGADRAGSGTRNRPTPHAVINLMDGAGAPASAPENQKEAGRPPSSQGFRAGAPGLFLGLLATKEGKTGPADAETAENENRFRAALRGHRRLHRDGLPPMKARRSIWPLVRHRHGAQKPREGPVAQNITDVLSRRRRIGGCRS